MHRSTDPTTSAIAAHKQIVKGRRALRQKMVLFYVKQHPGSTHGELASAMYRSNPHLGIICCAETPHKRLPELEKAGLVRQEGRRKCKETGNLARMWYPA